MTLAEGPALLSRLSTTQAVARHTPRTAACFAVVSYPAATKASRISASFAACRAFAPAIVFEHGCTSYRIDARVLSRRVLIAEPEPRER